MTVGELKEKLNQYDDDMQVMTKKTELLGNIAYVNSVKEDTYGFFGKDIPCVLLTDKFEESEE
jgi:hypothetical protein